MHNLQGTKASAKTYTATDSSYTAALRKREVGFSGLLTDRPNFKTSIVNTNHGKIEVRTFPDLNHLFQHATTGLPSEYGMIDETLAPEVMLAIKEWVLANC